MKGIKEAFIDAGEISQMLGIGMTKAYAIIKEYNAELEAKGYFTMRGKCPRKYFEQKIYGYEDYYNPDYEPQRNRSKVAEEMDQEMSLFMSEVKQKKDPTKDDRMFGFGFDSSKAIYQTRGFREIRDMSQYLIENRLDEIRNSSY